MQYAIIAIYVLFSVSGLVLFKLGSTETLTLNVSQTVLSLKISWLSILGLLLYVISFLIYMGMVSKNDLSYIFPIASGAVYLLTMLSSVLIFKESIQSMQILGSTFILVGLVLMNIKLR